MKAILIHGMGRSPLSMALLGHRLRVAGLDVKGFGYSAALESLDECVARLRRRIEVEVGSDPYLLVGHSLGGVLIRMALPELSRPPVACFQVAPPNHSPQLARRLKNNPLFKLLTGEMGQRLADPAFMEALPHPEAPTTLFAGTSGPRGRFSPFGDEPNDGIVALSEVRLSRCERLIRLPALHTFIMNAREVAREILRVAEAHA